MRAVLQPRGRERQELLRGSRTSRKTLSPVSVRVPPSFRLSPRASSAPQSASAPHDQLGAARLIVLQMGGNQRFDHFALALTYLCHVDLDGAHVIVPNCAPWRARCARHLGAPNHVLTGQAGDIGTGAPDPLALGIRRRSVVPIPPCAKPEQLTAGSAKPLRIRKSYCSG